MIAATGSASTAKPFEKVERLRHDALLQICFIPTIHLPLRLSKLHKVFILGQPRRRGGQPT